MTMDLVLKHISRGTPSALHNRTVVDRSTDSLDIARIAFRCHQVDGTEPHVRVFTVDTPVAPIALLPNDSVVERCVTTDTAVVLVASCGDAGHVLINALPRSASVSVSAPSHNAADALAAEVQSRVPKPDNVGKTAVRTWHLANHDRAVSDDRRIDTPSWRDIARNYTPRVRGALGELVDLRRPQAGGRLILWHGEPGTGKTTALRALMSEWEPWCAAQYIADPEQFFSHPSYIAEVLTRSPAARFGPTLTSAGEPEAMWRLVIAEDADEYLRSSARRDSGAALGRLLNLADGVLGQGFNTLILLTTNEELSRLHPAVVRPGRSIARIEFDRFTPSEARAWLASSAPAPTDPKSLAELFEISGSTTRIDDGYHDHPRPIGQYL